MKTLQRRGKPFKGYTLGLDLHQSFIQVVVLDKRGNDAAATRIEPTRAALEKLVREWQALGEVQVAFEACGCFVWVFDLMVVWLGRERVHAAHAAKLRMIAESEEKNDHNDAWWLAYMLYERRLPEAFVAEGALRDLRIAGRELRSYTDLRSDLIRRLRSSLAQAGRKLPKGWHTSEVKRAAVREVLASMDDLRGTALQELYRQIENFSAVIARWHAQVKRLCQGFVEVRVLMQEMPGMKEVVAGLIYGEQARPSVLKMRRPMPKPPG
jgi:transposase